VDMSDLLYIWRSPPSFSLCGKNRLSRGGEKQLASAKAHELIIPSVTRRPEPSELNGMLSGVAPGVQKSSGRPQGSILWQEAWQIVLCGIGVRTWLGKEQPLK